MNCTKAIKMLDCKTVRIFAYSSTRQQPSEAENGERDWGARRYKYGRVRREGARLLRCSSPHYFSDDVMPFLIG